jgi:hypothetical protein
LPVVLGLQFRHALVLGGKGGGGGGG